MKQPASPPKRLGDLDPVQREVVRRHIDLDLVRRALHPQLIYPILIALVAAVVDLEHLSPLAAFFAASCALAGARYLHGRRFPERYARDPVRAWRWFARGALATSALWGGFVSTVIALEGVGVASVLALVATAGTAAGAMMAVGPHRRLVTAMLAVHLVPIAVVFFVVDIAVLGAAALVFLGYALILGRSMRATYEESVVSTHLLGLRLADIEAARAEAERASQSKSDFVAAMSHEIRTPLNGVIGMTSLLLESELDPIQREHAELARLSGEALLATVNGILDFSKAEAGRVELEHIPFDPLASLEEVTELAAHQAQHKGLTLVFMPRGPLPERMTGDPARLRQVVANLIANAVKFTARGEVVVTARAFAGPAGERLRVEVRDTGIGIAAADQARLFKPFSQVDASTTRRYGGTGLGLALSKRLVTMMGGDIGCESAQGEGSTFWFEVPLVRADAPAPPAPAPEPPDVAGRRVLVIDGNATNRAYLQEQLTRWGCRARAVTSGTEALIALREAAASEPFDAAIVDHGLPDLDGAELAARVRADAAIARTAIMLLTSTPARGDATRFALHVDAYFSRPVRARTLRAGLASVLGRARVEQASLVTRHSLAEARTHGRILVAEDNPVNQRLMVALVQRLGLRIDLAEDGHQALTAVRALAAEGARYDLVLMDCQMPRLDGYGATQAIRRDEATDGRARTPIVALTASSEDDERARCLATGMDEFLGKPVRAADLAAIVARFAPGLAPPSRSAA